VPCRRSSSSVPQAQRRPCSRLRRPSVRRAMPPAIPTTVAHARWDKYDVEAALREASEQPPGTAALAAAPGQPSSVDAPMAAGDPSLPAGSAAEAADMTPVSTRRTGGGAGGDGSVQVRCAGAGLAESDLAAVSTRRAPAPTPPAYPPVRGSTSPPKPGAAASSGGDGAHGEGESAWREKGNAEFKAGRYAAAIEAYTRYWQLYCAHAFSLIEPLQMQFNTPILNLPVLESC